MQIVIMLQVEYKELERVNFQHPLFNLMTE